MRYMYTDTLSTGSNIELSLFIVCTLSVANKYSKYEAWFTQSCNDTSAIIQCTCNKMPTMYSVSYV